MSEHTTLNYSISATIQSPPTFPSVMLISMDTHTHTHSESNSQAEPPVKTLQSVWSASRLPGSQKYLLKSLHHSVPPEAHANTGGHSECGADLQFDLDRLGPSYIRRTNLSRWTYSRFCLSVVKPLTLCIAVRGSYDKSYILYTLQYS